MTPEALAFTLQTVLGGGEVDELRQLSGGASRETWAFTHGVGDDWRALVLRRDPIDGWERQCPMGLEVEAIEAAAKVGVPVPAVVASGGDFGGTGTDYMITTLVAGEGLGSRIVRSPALGGARETFGYDCGTILARIHQIDPAGLSHLPSLDPLDTIEETFREIGTPSAAVGLGIRLLREHSPSSPVAASVVHGDFRNGNLIVDETGIVAVLDWELVHVGDPLQDLGWLCTPAWRFGGAEPAGGIATYEQLLDGYEAEAGWRPRLADVLWWQLFGSIWWATICLRTAAQVANGESRTIDSAALARRASENELDILNTIKELAW